MAEKDLAQLRTQLDAIDAKIVKLLGERMQLSSAVGDVKTTNGTAEFADHAREAQILTRLQELAGEQLPAKLIERIYREIFAESLARQQPQRISYLGPQGTFSEQAAQARFGSAAQLLPQATIADCFACVEQDKADYAIVPYENSTDGGIGETLDLLVTTQLLAVGETQLRIRQNLIIAPGTNRNEITSLFYHPVSFAQCAKWLRANLLPVEQLQSCGSNSTAVKLAAQAGKGAAAIGPAQAAKLYDLEISESGIEDNPRNVTRFLVIGRHAVAPAGTDKTSLLIGVRHEPGTLYAMLQKFAQAKVNMTRLESRPAPGGEIGQYLFFIDVDGHKDVEPLPQLLDELVSSTSLLKVLGSYPAATPE